MLTEERFDGHFLLEFDCSDATNAKECSLKHFYPYFL